MVPSPRRPGRSRISGRRSSGHAVSQDAPGLSDDEFERPWRREGVAPDLGALSLRELPELGGEVLHGRTDDGAGGRDGRHAMHPLLVRRVFFPLHERLLGKRTLAWLAELQQTQWMDRSRLEEYRFRRLRRLLDHAYAHVPYYRRIFDEHDVPPHRIQSFDDLRRVPYLTRDDFRTHFTELMPTPQVPRSRAWSTGGSTGRPVTLMIDMDRMAFSDAARLRAHGWFGLDLSAREIALWGSVRDLSGRGVLRA